MVDDWLLEEWVCWSWGWDWVDWSWGLGVRAGVFIVSTGGVMVRLTLELVGGDEELVVELSDGVVWWSCLVGWVAAKVFPPLSGISP